MSAPLVLAVPAKGRLQENAETFFARSGLTLVKPRGARDYRGAISGLDGVEVAYLSAGEITAQLAAGAVHLLARRVDCAVVNAGDGAHEHPTQALLDALTIRRRLGRVEGLTIAMYEDGIGSEPSPVSATEESPSTPWGDLGVGRK